MNFTLAELTKLTLEPGEILAVKLYGDDYDEDSVVALQSNFKSLFPNNKVMIFVLPVGHDLQMEKLSATMDISELTQEQQEHVKKVNELVDNLNNDCSLPTSYCNNCSCGKKEALEVSDGQD